MVKRVHACQECGKETRSKGPFCSAACRYAFNNRRKQRGAELYDFFMDIRHNRDVASKNGLWQKACRLASNWKAEDDAKRDGRRSWRRTSEYLPERAALLTSQVWQDHTGRSTGKRT
jgi:hypothetical protein